MKFDGFRLHAMPMIVEASCRKCGARLKEVSNGFIGVSMFCQKCETVHTLKLVAVNPKKISPEYLEQCRAEVAPKPDAK